MSFLCNCSLSDLVFTHPSVLQVLSNYCFLYFSSQEIDTLVFAPAPRDMEVVIAPSHHQYDSVAKEDETVIIAEDSGELNW